MKLHGREVASRIFTRKTDAVAWEHEQIRKLRLGEWIDPKRGFLFRHLPPTGWSPGTR